MQAFLSSNLIGTYLLHWFSLDLKFAGKKGMTELSLHTPSVP